MAADQRLVIDDRHPGGVRAEVVYALRETQVVLAVVVEAGTTVRQAIERSGVLARFPEIDLVRGRVGVFGKVVSLDAPLRDGDRVEIYRELLADAREARRERARRGSRRQLKTRSKA